MIGPIRVLIADDHEVVRDGLRMILESEAGFSVVGEAGDGVQAVERCKQTLPDVVLMDLRMPRMDGLEAIAKIRVDHPAIAVVILTTYKEDELMLRGLRMGAKGYLLKDTSRQMLFDALRAAARGEVLLQPEILARVLAPPATSRSSARVAAEAASLTDREREVLRAVAQGERSKEIARRLGITERTVKAHLASVFNKLGVDSRAAAVSAAIGRGLLPPERRD